VAPQTGVYGRADRAGVRQQAGQSSRGGRGQGPASAGSTYWLPGTETPPGLNQRGINTAPQNVQPGGVAPGGVQTGGDITSPQQSPFPYNQTPGPEQTHTWWSAENQSDTLIHRQRNGYFQKGREVAGRTSSMPDPPASGPVRPDFKAINVTWNWQAGTGAAYQDNLLPRARPFVGQQDGSWVPVYGGTPGFYRMGPGGTPVRTQTDGPQRIYGGPPHGLTTEYPPDYLQTLQRYTTVPQMVPARVDRLSNSRVAGQSYSQTTQHQGQARRGGA
jgi:hypothetical protein